MMEYKQIRFGAVSWLAFIYCLVFLFLYFYMFLFEYLIQGRIGIDIFPTEAGKICHVICACVGSGIIMFLAQRDHELNMTCERYCKEFEMRERELKKDENQKTN